MSKGDKKTNKTSDKPTVGPTDSLRRNTTLPGKSRTKKSPPKASPPTVQSDPDTHRTKNPIAEITTMEVHHHPQLEHKPKPFKEYLLEGFMIFIAVMMGFIAENIRQTIEDNEHVQQLTAQLANDLKADTARLNKEFKEEMKILRSNDTLVNLLQAPLQKADIRKIQKLVGDSHSLWLFHPSAGAMTAIKNELHLKQFSNSELINYFSKYEAHIELLHTAQDVNLQYQRTYLDPFLTRHFTPENIVAALGNSSAPNGRMRNLSQEDLDQLAADIALISVVTNEMIEDNRLLKKDAGDFLGYVIKQYHLEKK
jgi:cell division protein FtsB